MLGHYAVKDVRLFDRQDFFWLLRRQKKMLIRFSYLGIFLACCLIGIKKTSYTIEASFKEQKEENGLESKDFLKQLFSASLNASSMHTIPFMKSRALLQPLIKKLGLQVEFVSTGYIKSFSHFLRDLWEAEWQNPLPELDLFRCKDVSYEGERVLDLQIRFSDLEHFEIFEKKTMLARGALNERISIPHLLEFCLTKAPQDLNLNKFYKIRIYPWQKIFRSLTKKLTIASRKGSGSLYDLSYKTRDRAEGVLIVNTLMELFQQHLKKEHEELAEKQLSYLAKRREELANELEKDLQAQACLMEKNLRTQGFFTVSGELATFLEPHAKIMNELFMIEDELEQLEKEGALTSHSPLAKSLEKMRSELSFLEQQKDLLKVSFLKTPELSPQKIWGEWEVLQKEKEKILGLSADLFLNSWVEKLEPKDLDTDQKEKLQEYLAQQARLFSLREKILSERFFDGGAFPGGFEGIDWDTSRSLFRDYTQRLDGEGARIQLLTDVLDKMKNEDVPLGCFSDLLKDPMSECLIAHANDLYLQLKEEKYCSPKEKMRWQEDLELQKKLFQEHIGQMLELSGLNAGLIREKLSTLQQVGLGSLQQQISVLEEKIREEITKRKTELAEEKIRLKEKLQELRSQFCALPDTWRSEKLFEFKSQTHQKIMEAMVQLVETKTIGQHLHHVGSGPLDKAIFPLLPDSPHVLLMIFLGIMIGGGGCFFVLLFRQSMQGFPMNGSKLEKLGLFFSGPLSSKMETLQKIFLFLNSPSSAQIIGLLEGKGPNFSEELAEMASRIGRKVILLDLSFSEQSGLLQFLEKKVSDLPIQKKGSFSYVSAGGSMETGWILSPLFSLLLSDLKKNYDWIFLAFSSPLESSFSRASIEICDKIVLSLQGEQIDLLTPFVSWAYDKEYYRLTFVASDVP